jgi:hypothetical protein
MQVEKKLKNEIKLNFQNLKLKFTTFFGFI